MGEMGNFYYKFRGSQELGAGFIMVEMENFKSLFTYLAAGCYDAEIFWISDFILELYELLHFC